MDYQIAYYALLRAQAQWITPEHIAVLIAAVTALAGVIWKLAQQSKQIHFNQQQIQANFDALTRIHVRIDALEKTRAGWMEEVSARLENTGKTLARFDERINFLLKEIGELKEEVKKSRERDTD